MASQRVSRRTLGLAVLLVLGLAASEARAQPSIDGLPPFGGPPPLGGPPIGRLPVDGPAIDGPPPLDRMAEPPRDGSGPGMGIGGMPSPPPPPPMPGELFRRPPGPAGLLGGPGMGRPAGGPLGPGGGPGSDLNPTPGSLLGQLTSSLAFFSAFWMFAALGMGLVLLALLVTLVILMKRSAAEKGTHAGTE